MPLDWTGQRLELTVGPVAHGGHCVARHEGRVIFVRHTLPGEAVLAEVTEDRGGAFCRADAVQIRQPAAERVEPACEYAHPGGCGGCDFQHVSGPGQRALKAAVIAEQLSRLAGVERRVEVRPLSAALLGWRRRIRFAVTPDGRLGLHRHRSSEIVALRHCPLGEAGVGDAQALAKDWSGWAEVELAVDDFGQLAGVGFPPQPPARGRARRPRSRPEPLFGPAMLDYEVLGHRFQAEPAGFWQSHPLAPAAFSEAVLLAAQLQPGERVLELYAGAGLFTASLAAAVGASGRVVSLEGDRHAAAAAERNLGQLDWAEVLHRPVTPATVAAAATPDVVVLDPPRTGAGREVMAAILAQRPRTVVYVACDPAALARDVRVAVDAGWRLADVTGFDAYPMTHHVECIAALHAQ